MMTDLPLFQDVGMPLGIERRKAFNEFNEMVYNGAVKVQSVDLCFCGSREFKVLSRYDRFGLPFGTKICKSCGLISQTLRIHPDSLPYFYDKVYWPLISGQENYSTDPKKDETYSYLLKHIPAHWKEIRIFEVGCGAGERISRLTNELKHSGRLVTAVGCDYSSLALRLAARNKIQTIRGGMGELSATGKADVLILSHVFEHFPDLEQSTAQIDKLIHDDTLVYIEVPGVIDLENKKEYSCDYQDYCVLAHTYNFSLSTLAYVMSNRGLKLVEGDEYVRAVFKRGQTKDQSTFAYEQIMDALKRARRKQLELENRRYRPILNYLRNIAKALLRREI
jgi:2-polyprenyl-3-methyl-5-hydroxy-6-metoxy-1,4-benzoquinol methylase